MAKYDGPELKNHTPGYHRSKRETWGEQDAKHHGDISFKPTEVEHKQKEEEPSLLAANPTVILRHSNSRNIKQLSFSPTAIIEANSNSRTDTPQI